MKIIREKVEECGGIGDGDDCSDEGTPTEICGIGMNRYQSDRRDKI